MADDLYNELKENTGDDIHDLLNNVMATYNGINHTINNFKKLNAPDILLHNILYNYEKYLEKNKPEKVKNVVEFMDFINQSWDVFQRILVDEMKKAYEYKLISSDFILRVADWMKEEDIRVKKHNAEIDKRKNNLSTQEATKGA